MIEFRARVIGFAAAGLIASGVAWAQPTLTTLGGVAPGSFTDAFAVSGDGLVVGGVAITDEGESAVLWNSSGQLQSLGIPAGAEYSQCWGVDMHGSVAVGYISYPNPTRFQAFRRITGGGYENLGLLPGGTVAIAYGVSRDGSVAVGYGNTNPPNANRAFRWTAAEGMQGLGVLAGGVSSIAYGANADGSVVTGYSQSASGDRAFRWTAGGMENLGVLPGRARSTGVALSADGSVVAGYSSMTNGTGLLAFRWTEAGGMQSLGVFPGGAQPYARAISADGGRIVGGSTMGASERAFLWTSAMGMVDLNAVLPPLGVSLAGWQLRFATGISADGTAIVGIGTLDGEERSFLIRGLSDCVLAGACCSADLDDDGNVANGGLRDGAVTIDDLLFFLAAFEAGITGSDVDNGTGTGTHDGAVTIDDLVYFLTRFETGC